jgi:addiction module HigA family antidote
MPMKNPSHPGEVLRETCLKPLGFTVTEAAKALGVSRVQLSRLLNKKSGLSPDMAVRLSKAFGRTHEHWLRLQMAYDAARASERASKIKVRRVQRKPPELP